MMPIKEDKKGQFYVVAAIMIIVIIIGMAGVSNYITTKEEPKGFYKLESELGLEGAKVIDYGIYNNQEISIIIAGFTEDYANYVAKTGEDFELAIVQGNQNSGKIIRFTKESSGYVEAGEFGLPKAREVVTIIEPVPLGQTKVIVDVGNKTYEFTLKENENFLFVMTTSEGFEKHVIEKRE